MRTCTRIGLVGQPYTLNLVTWQRLVVILTVVCQRRMRFWPGLFAIVWLTACLPSYAERQMLQADGPGIFGTALSAVPSETKNDPSGRAHLLVRRKCCLSRNTYQSCTPTKASLSAEAAFKSLKTATSTACLPASCSFGQTPPAPDRNINGDRAVYACACRPGLETAHNTLQSILILDRKESTPLIQKLTQRSHIPFQVHPIHPPEKP